MLGGERFGTLGGFLQSIDGRIFGVTAAHVIEQGEHRATPAFSGVPFLLRRSLQRCCVDTRYSPPRKWSAEFGSFKTLSAPEIVDDGQCRVSSNPTTKGLDVALVHFPSISPARLRRVNIAGTGQISQRLDAYFVGARSGLVRVRPSSLSIWHSYQSRFAEQNKFACISDCLEIALEPRPHVMTNVSSEGDSGSWLMSKAKEGLFWLGVLVGGDGDRSGVVPAQRIIDHFIPQFGPLTPMI
jgi:hypothetical protein